MLEILVQTATGTSNLSSTPVTFSNNNINGNSIIVAVGNSSTSSGDVSGITDSQGNVYSKAFTTDNSLIGDLELWYTSNIIGGANTITVAYTTGVACAVIAREYYGTAYPINILDRQTSNTGNSNSLSSGNTAQTAQSYELLIGIGLIPLTDTFTVGAGWSNLTTLNAPLVVQLAMEDQFITISGQYAATFGANTGLQWVCGIGTFFLAPTGTTTSTSFTTSTSISSTSQSSTSSSLSTTSKSTSTSSTSTSNSSTSISFSSTSTSTTSTSISSTSSSTSVSSTSTSISSTSVSSTSISSTSSSTSVSSTSSSISSTSSSVSSTSSSVSSTSVSSTSSSSSMSTTTVPPPYITYSYSDIPEQYQTPNLLQTKTAAMTGTVATTNIALNTTNTGSLILVFVNTDSAAPDTILSMSCTGMNLLQVDEIVDSSFCTGSLWMAYNITGATTPTLAVNWNLVSNAGVIVREYGNMLTTSNPLDRHATHQSLATNTNTPACGVGSLNFYNELVVGYAGTLDSGNTYTPGSGYGNAVTLKVSTILDMGVEDKYLGRTQTGQNAIFTINNADPYVGGIATFRTATYPLPPTNTNLLNSFNAVNYGNEAIDDGDYFIERGARYVIQEYRDMHINNTDNITFTWKGRSTLSTLISPILIQIYNFSTGLWETLANQTLTPADIDSQVTVTQSTNVANYYDATNMVTFRSYQQVN